MNWVLSFRVICVVRFLPILQSLSYGTPGETKLEVLVPAGSCYPGYYFIYAVSLVSAISSNKFA
jgi:hypothetical protein